MTAAPKYPLHRPVLGDEEAAAVARVLASGHLVAGAQVKALEAGLVARCAASHAVTVSSGTAALHVLLTAMDLAVGDGVVVPAFGYPATANAVELCGARAQPGDVDPDTFALTADSVAAAADATTVGVLVVHPFGIPAPLEPLAALCEARGWWLVEDAACALGTDPSRWGQYPACLSFHPRKTLTTAEGGAVMVHEAALAHKVRMLRSQGMDPTLPGWERFGAAGFNYRMSDVHAAIGVVQLDRLDDIVGQRRRIAGWYRDALATPAATELVRWPLAYDDGALSMQSVVVELTAAAGDRDGLIAALAERGIQTTIGGYATFEQPYYRQRYGARIASGSPVSSRLARRCLTLPVTHAMSEGDVREICRALVDDAQRVSG